MKLNRNHTKVRAILDKNGYLQGYRVWFDGVELPQINPQHEGIRDVFGGEKYGVIVKVTRGSTRHEDRETWKRLAKSEDRDYFVPILESGKVGGKDWTCQPFVPLKWEDRRDYRYEVDRLGEKYGLDDLHDGNYAIDRDRNALVIFDYGIEH